MFMLLFRGWSQNSSLCVFIILKCKCILLLFISIGILIWNLSSCLTGIFSRAALKQSDLDVSINKTFFEKLKGARWVVGKKDLACVGTWPLWSPVASPGGRGTRSRPCPVGGALKDCHPLLDLRSLLPTFSSKTQFLPHTGAWLYQNLVYGRILIENHFLVSPFQAWNLYFWHWLEINVHLILCLCLWVHVRVCSCFVFIFCVFLVSTIIPYSWCEVNVSYSTAWDGNPGLGTRRALSVRVLVLRSGCGVQTARGEHGERPGQAGPPATLRLCAPLQLRRQAVWLSSLKWAWCFPDKMLRGLKNTVHKVPIKARA